MSSMNPAADRSVKDNSLLEATEVFIVSFIWGDSLHPYFYSSPPVRCLDN